MPLVVPNGMPGIRAELLTTEAAITFGHENLRIFAAAPIIGSSAIDANNSPTTQLLPGLVMAKKDADSKWYEYDPAQTDGREVARGVLLVGVNMLNPVTGSAEDRSGTILEGGYVKAGALRGLDATARMQLVNFTLDDEAQARAKFNDGFLREVSKAANYTVTAADNLTEFVATAAVVFTLPAIGKGMRFKFRQQANASLQIAGATAVLVGLNGATYTTLTFNTAGQMLGTGVIVRSNDAGTKWIVENCSAPGTTITATWA